VAELIREGEVVRVKLSRIERLAALHGDVAFPLDLVSRAEGVPEGLAAVRGLRAPGLGIPGVVMLGTTRHAGGKDFCAVRGRGPAILIELDGHPFARILVSTPEPDLLIDALGLPRDGSAPSRSSG
jgi:hypothetical protein